MSRDLTTRLVSGAVGAGVLTVIHQAAQHLRDDAPRMDVVGMRLLARGIGGTGRQVPDRDRLFRLTLAGDLLSNSLYYSAIPGDTRRSTWARALALGLAAGAGALLLPRHAGAGDPPGSRSLANCMMTVAWYTAGALATAAAADAMQRDVLTGRSRS